MSTKLEMTKGQIEERFVYLDRLRVSGVTNMFGARPYLERQFGLATPVARQVLLIWMQSFDGVSDMDRRIERALEIMEERAA